ncbi:hypothetical protein L596_009763 [Steinernema carpocapsae]|uniref:Uncharacterized protein n=1 Tax=Steinernema carpocapsae TaxID=34508 RepID=A0A4U5PGA8_STECR|nr:hypothetical protein L596_009763 [Steinernema carpocapsae]
MFDRCCLRNFAKVISSVAFYFNFLTCVLAGIALTSHFGQWYRIAVAVVIVWAICAHCALNHAVQEDELKSSCFMFYFVFQLLFIYCTGTIGFYLYYTSYPHLRDPEKVVFTTLAISIQVTFLVYVVGYYRYRRSLSKLEYRRIDIMSLATYRMRYELVP